jgi:hypothetical protein
MKEIEEMGKKQLESKKKEAIIDIPEDGEIELT